MIFKQFLLKIINLAEIPLSIKIQKINNQSKY